MSWEDTAKYIYQCPCGSSTFTVRHRSNDWGNYHEVWEMQCPTCRSAYVLHEDYRWPKGIKEYRFGWVSSTLWQSYEEDRTARMGAENALRDYFRQEYWTGLMERFEGMSTKAIWEELTGGGAGYPVLSTFYKHVRDDGLETVVDGFVTSRHMDRITEALGVTDLQIDALLREIATRSETEDARLSEVRRSAVRTGDPLPA